MENKKLLFITYDLSGYYQAILEELQRQYSQVDFYNLTEIKFKYKNPGQRIASFFYKTFAGKSLKNLYKYQALIGKIEKESYDIALIVRPDVFFDEQLSAIRKASRYLVAYYHDSVNNIKRKKDVIGFFDKVYSYEKKDVQDYGLAFLPNFIYFEPIALENPTGNTAFTVMSNDYRLEALRNIAAFLSRKNVDCHFFVTNKQEREGCPVQNLCNRMDDKAVLAELKKTRYIVDVHKFGIQDGLTFRVFEALALQKKLITTNKDVRNYDFYNPINIAVIQDVLQVEIPQAFFDTGYEPVPKEILESYSAKAWVGKILAHAPKD